MKAYVNVERTQVTTVELDIPDGQDPFEYASDHIADLPLDESAGWATSQDSYEVVTVERDGLSFP